jgi:hypothetical protein
MAYSPPNTFYTQVKGLPEKEDMFQFIGKNGAHFKYLTEKMGLDYIWWNSEKNIIEIWGKHQKLLRARLTMEKKKDVYIKLKKSKKPTSQLERCDAWSSDDLINLV